MSRPIVRRLTAAVAVLAILCLAMPAAAAAGTRPSAVKAPVVLGSGLVDSFLDWVGSLWLGRDAGAKTPAENKLFGVSVPLLGTTLDSSTSSDTSDRGGMIDPNGNK